MKRILGLDLGTNSIGWALVNEAETKEEKSSIVKLGVRVNPLTVDEQQNFEKGKSITTNADRTLKRSMRRNLQRFKLRRDNLIEVLKENNIITDESILTENGNHTTFETLRLRAKAVTDEISLQEFARVLLMINKKRGYKSSRKAKSTDEGQLIDGMEVAKHLYDNDLTPGQFVFQLLAQGKKHIPDFYCSDLQNEFDKIWNFQKQFYTDILTDELKEKLIGKNDKQTWAICQDPFEIIGIKREGKRDEQRKENYLWRVDSLSQKIDLERLAIVFQEINKQINNASGYLGNISDRSKELFFNRQTVGQYLISKLNEDAHFSLKNKVFYRQDYLDEFETIWEKQSQYHNELTSELKKEIRDIVIFYQRPLKSQKGLISVCELEGKLIEIESDGKKKKMTIGPKVCPKSSPIFQEFKIWQILNNIQVSGKIIPHTTTDLFGTETDYVYGKRFLNQEEKEILFEELNVKEKLSKSEVLKLLFKNASELDLNYKSIDGNKTNATLFGIYQKIIELSGHGEYDFSKLPANKSMEIVEQVFSGLGYKTEILHFDSNLEGVEFEQQAAYQFWHLLYSAEDDNSAMGNEKLVNKITQLFGFEKEYAKILANVVFQPEYGSLSTKAIRKILPYLKDGLDYSVACEYAGYRHSKKSLTKEEIDNKVLKDNLELLPRNSLRNPVVEKILNQMVNVVNEIIATYGRPDEIRVELARELKKNQKEREALTKAIASSTKEREEVKEILVKEFNIPNPTRNDILRYRLYEELKPNGYHTLYSNKYIEREKLFSKEIDIEHIIPKARLFDDSFSNKTLEYRSVNLDKGNKTAYDYVSETYGEEGLQRYLNTCESLFATQRTKLRKLKMTEREIPDGFIDRDLRNTQYIAKKALAMLNQICRSIVPTTGAVTDQLRQDWELVDVLKELNWGKYEAVGNVEYYTNHDGHRIGKIKDWTKRNDHRHHAMDALTVAFTKPVFIQYFNHKNASFHADSNEYAIKTAYFKDGRAISPIPLSELRLEAKKHLGNILVSIKAKNKVATQNINKVRTKNRGTISKVQLTPRGQLHLETVYGSHLEYVTREEKVNASFTEDKIMSVCTRRYREVLLQRLSQFGGDAKKAFTGKNSLDKNSIWLDEMHIESVPPKVKTVSQERYYTVRKQIAPDLKIDKVVDVRIRQVLQDRLMEYGGDAKKAFSNLDENPIWLNKEKGISIKRVTIYGISNAQALHDKRDKDGRPILGSDGVPVPVDFVNTGNNHHVAIYCKPVLDKNGMHAYDDNDQPLYELEERVVSFYEVVERVNQGLPVVDKGYRSDEGWKFLYSMKQNECFVFPDPQTGFDPKEVDLMDPDNYALISPNLFRVQKVSTKDYWFRHHLETNVDAIKELQGITWKRIKSLSRMLTIVKVRLDHLGRIVQVGEY